MRRYQSTCGGYLAAFGAGMLVAVLCPGRLLLVLTAVVLVIAGIALIRC